MEKVRYNFSLPLDKFNQMKILAIRHRMPLNEFLLLVFEYYLKHNNVNEN